MGGTAARLLLPRCTSQLCQPPGLAVSCAEHAGKRLAV